ncbi:Testis-expressed protein 30 [Coccomyxa sp. Obi]|nr:Testis-expressed protein 30 [Coccomyxa sp. Obi]
MGQEQEITFGVAEQMTATLNRGAKDYAFGVILAHGAGGDSRSGHLRQVVDALSKAGFWCLRFDYKPPNLKKRVERFKALLSHAHDLHEKGRIPVKRWILAGHSMGGRVASAVAHEKPGVTLGCIFFSYPLHPPNKTSQLRDNPLTALTSPILFVRGTNDAFCEHEQFETVKARMTSSDVQVHAVESGDHSLRAKGGKQAAALAVAEAIETAVSFAKRLADAASATDGTFEDPPDQAGRSAPTERKRSKDAEAGLDNPTTKKRQRKPKTG